MGVASAPRPGPAAGRQHAPASVSFREQLGERICVAEPGDRAPTHRSSSFTACPTTSAASFARCAGWPGLGHRGIGIELRGHGGQPSPWADSHWVYQAYQQLRPSARARVDEVHAL